MLPMMMLQPTELATFTPEPNSAELLPQDATEPVVAFADILQVGLQPLVQMATDNGTPVPLTGNALPPASGSSAGTPGFVGDGVLSLPAGEPVSADSRPGGMLVDTRAIPAPVAETRLPPPQPSAPAEILRVETPPVANQAPASRHTPVENLLQPPVQQEATTPRPDLDGERVRPEPAARPQSAPDASILRPAQQTTVAAQSANAGADLADTVFSRLQRGGPVADSRPSPAPVIDGQPPTVSRDEAPLPRIARELPQQMQVAPPVQPAQIRADTLIQAEMPLAQGPATAQSPQVSPTLVSQTPTHPASNPTGAAAAQAQAPIDVPVRDTAWSGALGERVLVMANNQLQNAEIRLTPAELGPLRVQVAVDDGAANVTFHAQHALTREAIEQALPRLRELLAENGLTLNHADVGDEAGPGVEQGNREASGDGAIADSAYAQEEEDAVAESVAARELPRSRPEGLVDTFA